MSERPDNADYEVGLPAQRPPGVISLNEIYTLDEARARLGWSQSALRAAKRRGLNLLVNGKRRYVSGREICRFLESISTPSPRTETSN
jgi:hypothetical protein